MKSMRSAIALSLAFSGTATAATVLGSVTSLNRVTPRQGCRLFRRTRQAEIQGARSRSCLPVLIAGNAEGTGSRE